MNAIAYWIQHSDFSAEDFPPVDLGRALEVFREHDWTDERRQQDARASAGEEHCPAGIGFVTGDRILHICPTDEEYGLVHYHFAEERRLLGIFPRTVQTVQSNLRFPLKRAPEILARLYQGDHDWLSENIR